MKQKGKDVQKADEMVNKAERALEKGELSEAKKLAAKANDDLSAGKTNLSDSNDEEGLKKAYTVDELDKVEFKESGDAARKRRELKKQKEKIESLPDNFLESKFEMKLARDLLDEHDHGKDAEKYYTKAEKYFDDEDYTRALKYSIKCKKSIKGEEGAGLIAGQNIDKKEGPPKEIKERFSDLLGDQQESRDAFGTTERKVEKQDEERVKNENYRETNETQKSEIVKTCPECGFEGGQEDFYCPNCGVELITKNQCPECGSDVKEEDEFCRKCGTPLDESTFVCPECGVEVGQEDDVCPKCGIEFE
ncbi:MAG: zinc ribbon domain-containing protein [Candidatus Thermoplasmatota archaeon]|nr:zinc ribbon domain-containing protein [Candidatus Thermoplasmatota archaeon]